MQLDIKNISLLKLISLIFVVSLSSGCANDDKESEESKTIRLLTNDSFKNWGVVQTTIDDISQPISICDSSYILTLKADYSWEEAFLRISCYQLNEGTWELNDENTVISIQFISKTNGNKGEKKFEIIELSEEYFEYRFAQDNLFYKVRLHEL